MNDVQIQIIGLQITQRLVKNGLDVLWSVEPIP